MVHEILDSTEREKRVGKKRNAKKTFISDETKETKVEVVESLTESVEGFPEKNLIGKMNLQDLSRLGLCMNSCSFHDFIALT